MLQSKKYLHPNAIIDFNLNVLESNSFFDDFFSNRKDLKKLPVKITDLIEFDNLKEFKKSLHFISTTSNSYSAFQGKIKTGEKMQFIKVTINHFKDDRKKRVKHAIELTCHKIEDNSIEQSIPEKILANSQIAVFTVNRDYCLTFFSKSVIPLLRFLLKEKPVIGKSFFINEELEEEWINYFNTIFSDEKIYLDKSYQQGDKEFCDLLTLSPLKNEKNEIEGCTVCVNDIMHLKKEQIHDYQNHKKFQYLFDNNFLGIGIIDARNVMIQANDSLCKLLGISNNNLEKIKAIDFISNDEFQLLIDNVKRIYQKEISFFTCELKIKYDSDVYKYTQISVNGLYKDDKYNGSLITTMDISDQREIQIKEQELKGLKSKEKVNLKLQSILQEDLDSRIRELTTNQMLIAQKNNLIRELGEKLTQLSKKQEGSLKTEIRKIVTSIKRQNVFEDDWGNLKIHFIKMHPSFFNKLIDRAPKITEKDLRHCAYIKLGFSAKETSGLLGTLPRSIEQARFRIKKKLKLPVDQKLIEYLRSI